MIPLEKPSIETIETLRSEVASEGKCMVNAGQTKEIAQIGTEFHRIPEADWWDLVGLFHFQLPQEKTQSSTLSLRRAATSRIWLPGCQRAL
jgi:hypothetical protein